MGATGEGDMKIEMLEGINPKESRVGILIMPKETLENPGMMNPSNSR